MIELLGGVAAVITAVVGALKLVQRAVAGQYTPRLDTLAAEVDLFRKWNESMAARLDVVETKLQGCEEREAAYLRRIASCEHWMRLRGWAGD